MDLIGFFLVNIGPDLAKKIIPPENSDIKDYLKNSTPKSLFIQPSHEKEILDIVKQADGKHSTDSDGLSIRVVQIIGEIIQIGLGLFY